jgi:hypothetical protein
MIPNFWGRFFGNALEVTADGNKESTVWERKAKFLERNFAKKLSTCKKMLIFAPTKNYCNEKG